MASNKQTGSLGEEYAVNFLKEKNYQILARNWRYLKGEIDIIAKIDEWLVFLEVKTRGTVDFGNPEEFVSTR